MLSGEPSAVGKHARKSEISVKGFLELDERITPEWSQSGMKVEQNKVLAGAQMIGVDDQGDALRDTLGCPETHARQGCRYTPLLKWNYPHTLSPMLPKLPDYPGRPLQHLLSHPQGCDGTLEH